MLLCPHSKEIQVERILGIFLYKHADTGEHCTSMNTFDTKVDAILDAMINTRKLEESNTIKAILATSEKSRKNLYTKLSSIDEEQLLSDVLNIIVPLFWNMRRGNDIIQEMIATFGMPLIQNINILFQKNLSGNMVKRSKYLPMKRLAPTHITGLMQTLGEEQKKKKQGIEDILYGKN